jgi:hypothetical protein
LSASTGGRLSSLQLVAIESSSRCLSADAAIGSHLIGSSTHRDTFSCMSASATVLPGVLRAAALAAQDRVHDDFSEMVSELPDHSRIRDELERAIDDVREPEVQKELRRC